MRFYTFGVVSALVCLSTSGTFADDKKTTNQTVAPNAPLHEVIEAFSPEQKQAFREIVLNEAKEIKRAEAQAAEFEVPEKRRMALQSRACRQSHVLLALSQAGEEVKKRMKDLDLIKTMPDDGVKLGAVRETCINIGYALGIAHSAVVGIVVKADKRDADDLGDGEPYYEGLRKDDIGRKIDSMCRQFMQSRKSFPGAKTDIEDLWQELNGLKYDLIRKMDKVRVRAKELPNRDY